MLVLSRKVGERLVIGDNITVVVGFEGTRAVPRDQIIERLRSSPGQPIRFTIERAGEEQEVTVVPESEGGIGSSSLPHACFWPISKAVTADTKRYPACSRRRRFACSLSLVCSITSQSSVQVSSRIIGRQSASLRRLQAQ